jgi:predicted nucleotidyltransferase
VQRWLGEQRGLVCAYLFGSHARDEAAPESDVDVAVLLERDPPRTLAELHLDLAEDLTERPWI